MASLPPGSYKVEPAGTLADQLRELTARAAGRGIKSQFLASVKDIVRLLSVAPTSWGDRKWTYQTIGLHEYHRIHEKLLVRYAVDEERHLVYWKELIPVLNHPLIQS